MNIEHNIRADFVNGQLVSSEEVYVDGVRHPDPGHPEDWVFVSFTSASGYFITGQHGEFRRKTIEEKDFDEAMKEVNAIAPGYPV